MLFPRAMAALAANGIAVGEGLVVSVVVAWQWQQPPETGSAPTSSIPEPPSPQLTYQGVFQNIHPDVQYVGDAVCARCHKEIARTYKASGMGRSMLPIAAVVSQQPYGQAVPLPVWSQLST